MTGPPEFLQSFLRGWCPYLLRLLSSGRFSELSLRIHILYSDSLLLPVIQQIRFHSEKFLILQIFFSPENSSRIFHAPDNTASWKDLSVSILLHDSCVDLKFFTSCPLFFEVVYIILIDSLRWGCFDAYASSGQRDKNIFAPRENRLS